jgi:hypothetical protein
LTQRIEKKQKWKQKMEKKMGKKTKPAFAYKEVFGL